MYNPIVPRDYQVVGIERMRNEMRLLNTDAPGLGKTMQAVFASEVPVLISVPNYLVGQWGEWLRGEDEQSRERNDGEVYPNVVGRVVVATGTRGAKNRALRARADWTVINHQMFRTHLALIEKIAKTGFWKTLIIDESHYVKNHSAAISKGALKISKLIPRCYLLSATPVKREIDDLYMQFKILHPDLFPSYNKFIDYYCVTDKSEWGVKVLGSKKKTRGELMELLDVMRIGRSYAQAGRSLPPVIEKYITIDLPPETRKLYDDAMNNFRVQFEQEETHHYFSYIEVYHQLRQLVTGAFKWDAVIEALSDEVHKSVIFTWYKPTAYEIGKMFKGPIEVVTGDIKDPDERRKLAKRDTHCVCTISSMSEGVDLSDARTVIFAEEDWTPGANYQALSRVVRDRNDDGENMEPVIVYYVHCKNTIDQIIHRRSKKRTGTIKELMTEALYQ